MSILIDMRVMSNDAAAPQAEIYLVLKSRKSSHESQTYQICSNFIDDATLFSFTKWYFTLVLTLIHMMLV